MYNLFGALIALVVFVLLTLLFGLVWLAGTLVERLTRLFEGEN